MTVKVTQTAVTIAIIALGGALLIGTAATARGPDRAGPDFSMLDQNADGVITAADFDAMRAARWEAMDADSDGLLSQEEMIAHAEGKRAERMQRGIERMFDRADANEDGLLSIEELQDMGGRRRAARLDDNGLPRGWDSDGDGQVTEAEFETALAEGMGRFGGKRRHGLGEGHGTEGGSSE